MNVIGVLNASTSTESAANLYSLPDSLVELTAGCHPLFAQAAPKLRRKARLPVAGRLYVKLTYAHLAMHFDCFGD